MLVTRPSDFPGLHCYTRQEVEGEELPPVLLNGILEAVKTTKCKRFVFVGDSDTLTNIEYYRSAGVLAQELPEGVSVELLQVPLGGPKGIDDIRQAKNSQFPEWLAEMEAKTRTVDKTKSFLVAAAHCLEPCGEALHALPPADRDHQIERLIRMAAYARISKEGSLAIENLCKTIQKLTKLNKDTFNKVLAEQVREIAGGDADAANANDKIAYYDRIQPWPVERPLIGHHRRGSRDHLPVCRRGRPLHIADLLLGGVHLRLPHEPISTDARDYWSRRRFRQVHLYEGDGANEFSSIQDSCRDHHSSGDRGISRNLPDR